MKLTKSQRKSIATNKRLGLLCACNAVRVPYQGPTPDEHGTKLVRGTLHGYGHCAALPDVFAQEFRDAPLACQCVKPQDDGDARCARCGLKFPCVHGISLEAQCTMCEIK